jgi:nicotinamidase-related amidase
MRATHQASSEPAAKLAKGPVRIEAEPYEFVLLPEHCALVIIDMQRDFLEPGGFGEMLGNDVSQLRRTIEPNKRLLAAWRGYGLPVFHTREGHRPDLFDLPPAKKIRGRSKITIGDKGPMGRILVRGEAGHDIIPELYPEPGEANDRGYECLVLSDCCGSYFPEFHEMGLKMVKAQGGIFGWVTSSERLLESLAG